MTAPSVTAVVPVFNGERFVADALQSLLDQDYGILEVVVVDDGSTDRSPEIVQAFPVRYVRQDNAGVAAARNAGVAQSTGDLVCFCDQDDLYHTSKVSKQVEYLEAHPEVAAVLCRQELFYEPGIQKPDWIATDTVFGDPGGVLPTSVMVARRDVLDVGGFDTKVSGADDLDLLIRLGSAGLAVAVLDEALYRRRIHEANLSNTIDQAGSMLAIIRHRLRRLPNQD